MLWRETIGRCTGFWKDVDKCREKGYLGPLVAMVLFGVGWALSLVFAIILTAYCIIISIVLFFYGLMEILWWREKSGLSDGETADELMSRLNGCINKGSKHFGVEPMLKMTTGLDVEDVWLSTQRSTSTQAHITCDNELWKLASLLKVSPTLIYSVR